VLALESAVALKEVGDAMTQYHIVNNCSGWALSTISTTRQPAAHARRI
jgi:hypothetical protein